MGPAGAGAGVFGGAVGASSRVDWSIEEGGPDGSKRTVCSPLVGTHSNKGIVHELLHF